MGTDPARCLSRAMHVKKFCPIRRAGRQRNRRGNEGKRNSHWMLHSVRDFCVEYRSVTSPLIPRCIHKGCPRLFRKSSAVCMQKSRMKKIDSA